MTNQKFWNTQNQLNPLEESNIFTDFEDDVCSHNLHKNKAITKAGTSRD